MNPILHTNRIKEKFRLLINNYGIEKKKIEINTKRELENKFFSPASFQNIKVT